MHSSTLDKNRKLHISFPEDFRQVSSIIDVDVVPETCRRVRLVKHGSEKPLGFYIRDGTSVRVTVKGLEKVPGIFISRLVPGGLAESTGLLAVNDEVLEVNGIEVLGKSLDQVTDMMVANSSNLILTIKPVNNNLTIKPVNERNQYHYPKITSQQQSTQQLQIINQQQQQQQQNHHHRQLVNNNNSAPSTIKQSCDQRPDQRIPQNIENTLPSSHDHSQSNYYLKNKNEKVPIQTSSNNYLVNLADGEDSDEEEDEVKEHTNNFNNKNKDLQNKIIEKARN